MSQLPPPPNMDPTPPPATATAEAPPPENLDNYATQFPPDGMQNPPGRAMANFKAFVMAIAASDPKRPLTRPLKTLIENKFHHFFHDSHTPDHPPYAAMITTALQELREEGGSSEDSISEFIKSKHDDLPRAHSTFLKLHLGKLCESGEIDVTHEKYCLLGAAITKLSLGQNTGGRSKMKKPEEKRDRPCTEGSIEEENETKETARTEMEIQATEEHNQPAGEYNEVILEQDEVEEKDEVRKVQNQTIILDDAIGHGGCEEKARQQKIPEQQQQEQEKPHPMKLVVRLRPPMPESASVANVPESLPLDHCHEQKAAFTILSPTNQQSQNEQQQQVKRGRGRPPKTPKAVADTGSLLKSSDQLQKHQARRRKPKCKPSAGQSGERRRRRPPKLRPEANETTGLSLNSSFQHNPHLQMQQGENLAVQTEIEGSISEETQLQSTILVPPSDFSEETQLQSAILVPPSDG